MSDQGVTPHVLPPGTAFCSAPFKRPDGQRGDVYLLPTAIVAIAPTNPDSCNVYLSSGDTVKLEMPADAFLGLIGGVLA